MKTEKITAAVQDETFAKSLIDMESPEEVKKAFAAKDVEISLEEAKVIISTIQRMIKNNSTELREEDLKEISGGGNTFKIASAVALGIVAAGGIAALGKYGYDVAKELDRNPVSREASKFAKNMGMSKPSLYQKAVSGGADIIEKLAKD